MQSAQYQNLKISVPDQRICFWGAPAMCPAADRLTTRLARTGGNSGNLLIGHGLFQNTRAARKSYFPGVENLPPEELHNRYDTVLIPASNFVAASRDLEEWYEYFSKTKAKLVCFGLGSQVLPGQDLKLKPGTERFLRLLDERGSIGVRGTFTAEILRKQGIRNISIIGCPSLLSLTKENLDSLVEKRPTLDRLAVNYSNNVRGHAVHPDALTMTENNLFGRALRENSFYVLQSELQEVMLLEALQVGDDAAVDAVAAKLCTAFAVPVEARDIAKSYFRERMLMFFSVDEWRDWMAGNTASIGSRFHGNVIALLAGTPALFLAHDMRTLELCELYRVPHLVIDRAYSEAELIERLLACDYAPFAAQLARLQVEWKLFLNRNGLDVAVAEE